jgi:hypothetical protein
MNFLQNIARRLVKPEKVLARYSVGGGAGLIVLHGSFFVFVLRIPGTFQAVVKSDAVLPATPAGSEEVVRNCASDFFENYS